MYVILLISFAVLAFLGLLIYKSWLNPVTIFNIVWLVVCALYGLRLSPRLQPELANKTCEFLILGNVVFTLSCLLVSKISIKPIKKFNISKKELTFSEIRPHFWFWIFIEIVETIYSKGLPIMWAMQKNGKTYFDYGIPTFHGLANAYGLSILSILAYELFKEKKSKESKKIITYILTILLMYALLLTRQVIISAVIQMFIIYYFLKPKIPIGKIIVTVFVGIIIFGLIGNIRTGYSEFLSVSLIDSKINPFFIGFYWVYMYLTMTIANLNKMFTISFNPVGIGYFAAIYLPTVISKLLFKTTFVDKRDRKSVV